MLSIFTAPLSSAFYICAGEKYPYSDVFCRPAPTVTVYEYRNENTGRRVLISDAVEINAIDQGLAGPGWRRTSLGLTMLPADYNQSAVGRLDDVCRFYAPSVNSHFYSGSPAECLALQKAGSGWLFERVAFKTDPPVAGACPTASPVPVYRYYSNRAAFGDSAHRYSPDRTLKAELEGAGWIDEGIGFCALGWQQAPAAKYTLRASQVIQVTDIPASEGFVVASGQNRLNRIIPFGELRCDNQVPRTPFLRRTGLCDTVHTAQSSADFDEVDKHSFVQMSGSDWLGIYVNARDINSTTVSSTSLTPTYAFTTTPPTYAGATDLRLMPWRDNDMNDVEISFGLSVQTLLLRPGGHAIAHPVIELMDTLSRRSLLITIGTVSGEPQADFTARDIETGKPTVSTLFRADPAFGQRLSGESLQCNTENTASVCVAAETYRFRLRPADIAGIIKSARKLDPLLSGRIADYAIAKYSFKSEASGDAEIGLRLSGYTLTVYRR